MADRLDPPTGAPTEADAVADNTGSSMMRASAVMSAGTALSRVTGFVRVAVIAWSIGATESKLSDTYNLANSLPNIVYQLLLGEVLATIFVPVFVEHAMTRAREESSRLASTILNLTLILGGGFAAITVATAPWLIKIYTFHTDPTTRAQQEQVGAFFLRIFMPQMICYAAISVLTGVLNARRRFAAPMFAPVLNNFIVIATFVIFRLEHGGRVTQLDGLTFGDKLLLSGGTTLGVLAMTLALVPSVRALKIGFRIRVLEWRNPAIRHVGNLAKWSFAYVVANQVALWVVYALANGQQGGVTVYQWSWILYQLPYGIFAVSFMTFISREISEHHVRGDTAAIRKDVSLGLRTTAFVVFPAAAGFVALSRPIIRLLLQHGTFGPDSTVLAAQTFALMAMGLGAYAAFQQIMRAFYSMQDTKTPFAVNVACTIANIVAAIPLYRALGVKGLGLAHTISYLTGAAYGLWLLRKRLGGLDGERMLSSHARIAGAAIATGAVSWAVARAFTPHSTFGEFLQVGSAVTAGLAIYAGLAKALRIGEMQPLLAMVSRRFGRRKS